MVPLITSILSGVIRALINNNNNLKIVLQRMI
jgi:hypothetical protein